MKTFKIIAKFFKKNINMLFIYFSFQKLALILRTQVKGGKKTNKSIGANTFIHLNLKNERKLKRYFGS